MAIGLHLKLLNSDVRNRGQGCGDIAGTGGGEVITEDAMTKDSRELLRNFARWVFAVVTHCWKVGALVPRFS
jgi:hypothetical protein